MTTQKIAVLIYFAAEACYPRTVLYLSAFLRHRALCACNRTAAAAATCQLNYSLLRQLQDKLPSTISVAPPQYLHITRTATATVPTGNVTQKNKSYPWMFSIRSATWKRRHVVHSSVTSDQTVEGTVRRSYPDWTKDFSLLQERKPKSPQQATKVLSQGVKRHRCEAITICTVETYLCSP